MNGEQTGGIDLVVNRSVLSWEADLRLSPRATLQEFVSHDEQAILRVILHADQRAQVEVNDRIVAETVGFQNAAALAELYTRSHEILLKAVDGGPEEEAGRCCHYHISAVDGTYEVRASANAETFVEGANGLRTIGHRDSVTKGIDLASEDAGKAVIPAFTDQDETYQGFGQHGSANLVVAIWSSRWRTPFIELLREDELAPLYLTVSKAPDGAYFTIYRLANGCYLSELRSHHEAEQIGTFETLETAIAYCGLFNTVRHSKQRLSFSGSGPKEMRSQAGGYLITETASGFDLRSSRPDEESLGRFPSVGAAEAYATAHRDALEHFSLLEA